MITLNGDALTCLRHLASLGALKTPISISTQTLGEHLGLSQQTASRRILILEQENLITRGSPGPSILITPLGEEYLRREFIEYAKIFSEEDDHYIIKGIVVSGVGEGRYYMSIPHYQTMFTKLCGFTPYPGTLNVKLDTINLQLKSRLESRNWMIVPGFKDEHRQFGDARCLLCSISGIPCAIVAPLRTHHPSDIIEIISGEPLRKTLTLTDGTAVDVTIA